MGVIKAVCTSDIKGIQKTEQAAIELRPNWGDRGRAQLPVARQVSLLSLSRSRHSSIGAPKWATGRSARYIIVEGST